MSVKNNESKNVFLSKTFANSTIIKSLNIYDINILTNNEIQNSFEGFPKNLQWLYLRGTYNDLLTPYILQLKHLTTLSMDNPPPKILPLLTYIQQLYLVNCDRIYDKDLKLLPKNINYISLINCTNITDIGCGMLSTNHYIIEVWIAGCISITDKGKEILEGKFRTFEKKEK